MPSTFRMHADSQTFTALGFVAKTGLEIHFDLAITPGEFMAVSDTVRPLLADAKRITGYIRSDGRMYDTRALRSAPYDVDDPGTLGVLLLSDDPDLNLATPLLYLTSFEMPGEHRAVFAPYYISGLPADSTAKYLADFAPGPGQTAVGDLRGPQGNNFGGLAAVSGHPEQKQPMMQTPSGAVPAGAPVDFTEAIHDGIVEEVQNNQTVLDAASAVVDVAIQGKIGSGLKWKGGWNPATNSPALVDGTGTAGDQWMATVEGTRNFGSGGKAFSPGDCAVYNGATWDRFARELFTLNGQWVQIGGNADYPRSSAPFEAFAATVEPNNAINGDMWADYSGDPPTITTTSLSLLNVGVPTDQILAATGAVPISGFMEWTVIAGTPPAGLVLSSAGELSGTPTATGAFSFTVRAKNAFGSATQPYSGTVGAAVAPSITTTSLGGTLTAGQSYLQVIMANGSNPKTWSVIAGTLPAGLVLDPGTGVLSGTPTATGAFSFTVRVSNIAGQADQPFSGTITGTAPVITTAPLAAITQGAPFTQDLAFTGTTPIAWDISAGTIPSGLAINPTTGQIYGTPSGSGAYDFTVRGTNTYGSGTKRYIDTIASGMPAISTTSLNLLYRAVAFSQTPVFTGATPITWTVVSGSGSLPAGLSLNPSTGAITGTPTTVGAYSFTLRATNTYGNGDMPFSGSVLESTPNITETSLNTLRVGTAFSQTIHATGYSPITWTVPTGSLPAGLSLNSTTGVISGNPTTAGSFSFTLRATNSLSAYDDQPFSGSVTPFGVSLRASATPINNVSSPNTITGPNAQEGDVVVVWVEWYVNSGNPTISATYDYGGAHATAMTNKGQQLHYNLTTTMGLACLVVTVPTGAAGAKTIQITSSVGATIRATSDAFMGVTTIGTLVMNSGNSTTPSVTVAAATGNMVATAIGLYAGNAATTLAFSGSSATSTASTDGNLFIYYESIETGYAAGAASTVITATASPSGSWSAMGLPLVA